MENSNSKKQISVSEIITLMSAGYTRTNTARNYNPETGSIQEYYDLPKEQVKLLFEHPKLKDVKTTKVVVPMFDLVDDTTSTEDDNASVTPGVTANEEVNTTETAFDNNQPTYNTFA
jgi:hypothetical protein